MLHGDAVALAAHAASCHRDGAVVVRQRRVLQHRHVPQEGVGTLLGLEDASEINLNVSTARLCLTGNRNLTLQSKRTVQKKV